MIDARNLPKAIQWYEGMLLAPQHFQQLNVRQEELLHYHIMTASPFHWGIKHLVVDQVLLVDGIFRILDMEAVMPDGLVVCHRHGLDKSLEVDLSPFEIELKQREVAVHLAVPVLKVGKKVVKGALPRFGSIAGDPVPDYNTGESEMSIPRLSPRLTLLVTDTPPEKYSTFPLAKVTHKNETYSLTDFVPPLLSVAIKSPIWDLCSALAQRLREKAVFLSERITSPSSPVAGAMALETRFLIHDMVSGLPHFEAILNVGVCHPFTLYLSLCTLVGTMAGLGAGLVPPALPKYEHDDLRTTFETAKSYVVRMLEQGVIESHTAIVFHQENGVFSLTLRESWMSHALVIGVRERPVSKGVSAQKWMEDSLIGSQSVIRALQEKRILGAPRERIESDQELIPPRGVVLFSVKPDKNVVKPNEKLIILNTSDPGNKKGPLEITFYIRNKN